jgi:hypothetical protein
MPIFVFVPSHGTLKIFKSVAQIVRWEVNGEMSGKGRKRLLAKRDWEKLQKFKIPYFPVDNAHPKLFDILFDV